MIPLIDLALFDRTVGAEARDALAALRSSCETSGAFLVRASDGATDPIRRSLTLAGEFFALPLEEKMQIAQDVSATQHGYQRSEAFGSESFFCVDVSGAVPGEGPEPAAENLWPKRPASFYPVVCEASRALKDLSRRILRVLALSCGLEAQALDWLVQHNGLRLRHYDTAAALKGHTDIPPLTILAADGPGLETQLPDGQWVALPTPPDTVACMVGDVMRHLTNGDYVTALHRVVPCERPRCSLNWANAPQPSDVIDVLPTFRSAQTPARWAPRSFAQFVDDAFSSRGA